MSSKAEIEAQIAALQARLRETTEYDPAFTPAELVRWDPSLVGTVLHIQHERKIPANAFKQVMRKVPLPPVLPLPGEDNTALHLDITNIYGSSDRSLIIRSTGNKLINNDTIMETSGILKSNGIYHIKGVRHTRNFPDNADSPASYFTISNKFDSMTLLSFLPGYVEDDPRERSVASKYNLSCKELGMYLNILNDPYEISKKIYNWILPLANPDRLLLDQIHIAIQIHMHGRDVITDKYPLSILYQEWKRDKVAGRMHRRTPLDEAMITIRALQEELRLAREARAAADAHSEKLRLALHASAGIKDSENPV
jgi:hypothetical protein